MNKILADIVKKAEKWPKEMQDQLAGVVSDIEEELDAGVYHATPEELRGIDRGLAAARGGKIATKKQVRAAFAKFRKA